MFTELQEKIAKSCLDKNGKIPDTWSFEANSKGIFYIESTTGKKRYGELKKCCSCNRDYVARKDWKNVIACSSFCATKLRESKIKLCCSWCGKETVKSPSKLNNSKHGLYFCNRECKENAQSIGGIETIQPDHYGDGTASYAARALRHYGEKCCDCGLSFKPLLSVHHVDENRENRKLENLEVLCSLHHDLRHMRFDEENQSWIFDTKCLTPRDKLEELKKLLIGG